MTDLTQECRWDNKTNYKYSFDYVEYAGCYLNPDNKSDPEAEGEYLWTDSVQGKLEFWGLSVAQT